MKSTKLSPRWCPICLQNHNDIDTKHSLPPLCWMPFSCELLQAPVACSLTCQTPESRDECGSCLGGCSGDFGLPSIHPSSVTAYSAIGAAGWPQPNITWNLTSQQPPLRRNTFPRWSLKMVQRKMSLHPPSTLLSERKRGRIFGKHSGEFSQVKVPRKINRKINKSIGN